MGRFKFQREFFIDKKAEKIDYPEADAVAYISTYPTGNLWAMGFHGKAQKPDFHYSFKTSEQMEEHISKWVAGLRSRSEMMAKRKEARKTRTPGENGYLSVSETAVFVRQILAESFPGIKFSVRSDSYAGGASIDVSWTDGPTTKQVDGVVGFLEAAYFDSMIDYQGSRYHKLDGKPVHLGADYIQTHRHYTDELLERVIDVVWKRYAWMPDAKPAPSSFNSGATHNIVMQGSDGYANTFQSKMHEHLGKWSQVAKPMDSLTRARFAFAGDDGYGQGTFGKIESD